MRRRTRVAWAWGLLAGLVACAPTDDDSLRVFRLVREAEESGSTAWIDRARLSNESRYVLPVDAPIPLLDDFEVELPEGAMFEIELELPPELQATGELVIEASLHGGFELYETFRAEPIYLQVPEGEALDHYSLVLELPRKFWGVKAALSAVGHSLRNTTTTEFHSSEVVVPKRGELRFGYAAAPGSWATGWAPLRFRAFVRAQEGEEELLLIERRIDPARNFHDRHWFDARVDLAAFVGRSVRFRFEAEALMGGSEVRIPRALPLISNPEVRSAEVWRPRSIRTQPNVLLISLDTLRAQSVSTYGYARDTMPALTRGFAADGALVEQAVTPFPQTTASHMSMLTGLEPCAHGVLDQESILGAGAITLAERFREAGYRTAAFTEDLAIADGLGYERGFDRYLEQPPKERFGMAPETFEAAQRWIAEPTSQPFFAFVHTYEVHGPYTPPLGYSGFFSEESNDQWKQKLLRYDQEIRYTDDLLDDFLARLDALGLREDTLVIVTADHGEEFMEHEYFGHGYALYDESILVPMLFRFPGRIEGGQRIASEVGLIDLTPTVLDLIGLGSIPDTQGRSFASLMTGEGEPFEERPVYSFDRRDHHAVRTSSYKYYKRGRHELLFDLAADPGERTNLARKDSELLAMGRRALMKARAACQRWRETHVDALPRDVDAETRAELTGKLRALGYLAQ